MTTVEPQIKTIIEELTSLQSAPTRSRAEDDDFGLPRMIAVGDGGSLVVNRSIDQAILQVADFLFSADASLSRRVTRAEWRKSVRAAFGPALATTDLELDPAANAGEVLCKIKESLARSVGNYTAREHAFGCTLFGHSSVEAFSVGPVRFESRLDWLTRKRREGAVSATTFRRVEQKWSGRRLRKRRPSFDSNSERDILEAIGSGAFVCSVETTGLAAEAAREKALTAARLAITAIALLWESPSRALEGMNLIFDRPVYRRRSLTFLPGKVVLGGSSLSQRPQGPWLKQGDWESEFAARRDYFRVVGEILAYVVDPHGRAARPAMMNTLSLALLWYHEGSRELASLIATVKYSAALDALACGGKSGGMRRLINARLGIQDGQSIRRGGPTLKQAIDMIYGEARSRTIHGTNTKTGYDWSEAKGISEQFGRLCLLQCIDWAAQNPLSDEPANFTN